MPQRKVPFSGKKKKEQLAQKKLMKKGPSYAEHSEEKSDNRFVKRSTHKARRDRYAIEFYKETEEQILELKKEAISTIHPLSESELEFDGKYFTNYDFPKRPPWNYTMSKESLDRQEIIYFKSYIDQMRNLSFVDNKLVSYFELNLETWRQLWRVLEISDVVLFIVDIRYPSLMFPPDIYKYVVEKEHKNFILVLNKIDLVPAEVVIAWQSYFSENYPEIRIVLFSSYQSVITSSNTSTNRRRKIRVPVKCIQGVIDACKDFSANQIDYTSWNQKLQDDTEQISIEQCDEPQIIDSNVAPDEEYIKYRNGILTLGCIGFPNVGKSSVINALKGRKVVSVSKTPGHTKHFQTIFLTHNIKLCDCPGLVFPSDTPRKLQVLMGSYPIAQLRQPYESIKYLAERINLIRELKLSYNHPNECWSALSICEAYAVKCNYKTAKAARPDTYRAANQILRMTLDGKICLRTVPPGFFNNIDKWRINEEISQIQSLQLIDEQECLIGTKQLSYDQSEHSETGSSENDSDDDTDEESNSYTNPFSILQGT